MALQKEIKKDYLNVYDNNMKVERRKDLFNFCDTSINMLIEFLFQQTKLSLLKEEELEFNLTPIEQIFYVAYNLYVHEIDLWQNDNSNLFSNLDLIYQKKVTYENNKYIIDFVINFNNIDYAIELDGKEYHSSTKQINYDYQRERDLQNLGYKIIRFTGSQIYNSPFTCIDELFNILICDYSKRGNKNG